MYYFCLYKSADKWKISTKLVRTWKCKWMFLHLTMIPTPRQGHSFILPHKSHSITNKQTKRNVCAWFCSFILTCGSLKRSPSKKDSVYLVCSIEIHFINSKNCTLVMERSQNACAEVGLVVEWPAALLVVDLVDCCFLVSRARHDVFVIYGNVTAQHRGWLLWL